MKIPNSLHKYFWDVDVKKLDPEKDSYFVINRLLDKGDVEAVRWVRKTYSKERIAKTFTTMRGYQSKVASFWSLFLKIPQEKNNMFTGTLSVEAQNALALLGKNKILPKNTFLAGGSALALQFGHRISVDFDFFTPTSFDGEELRQKLEKIGEFIFQEADKKDFIDAEKTKMPEMIEKVDWEKVKEFFRKETIRLAKKYIGI